MDQRKLIYDNNKISINLMLVKQGYEQTFAGFLKAIEELGDNFLHSVYSDVSSRWSNADGKGWAKFKNIFNKASDIVGKVGKGATIANAFLNPAETVNNNQTPATPPKQPWKPNLYLWGGLAAAVIVLLVVIYIFKS